MNINDNDYCDCRSICLIYKTSIISLIVFVREERNQRIFTSLESEGFVFFPHSDESISELFVIDVTVID